MIKSAIITITTFLILISCGNNETESSKKDEKIEKQLQEYALKYDAMINWQDSLRDSYNIYTYEVQKFFSENKRAILIEAELEDVINIDGKYYLEIKDSFSRFNCELVYSLSCDIQIVEKILADSSSFYYTPVIIAKIESVNKKTSFDFEIDSYDEYDASGSIVPQKVIFLRGKCIQTFGEIYEN